jgi:ubiquinone/menaquinone biosynthesis C-methylase UbiE
MQFIAECTDLGIIKDSTYDFVISSNCLEHTANPIKALEEWVRVIKPGGYILLILPKKDNNYDNKRQITKFSHLIDDYKCGMGEEDTTHMEEVLNLHDLTKDTDTADFEALKKIFFRISQIVRCIIMYLMLI